MRKNLFLFATLFVILYSCFALTGCSGGGSSSSPAPISGGGSDATPTTSPTSTTAEITIRGRIVVNGNPVPNALMTFYSDENVDNPDAEPVAETHTDSQGWFLVHLPALAAGHNYAFRLAGGAPTVVNIAGTDINVNTVNFDTVGITTVMAKIEENPLNSGSLAGTKVSVGGSYEGTTDENGRAAIPNIPDNTLSSTGYEITISRDGFQPQTITGIRVAARQVTYLNDFDATGNSLGTAREIKLQLNPGTKTAEYDIGASIMDLCYVAENHLYIVAFDLPNKVIDFDLNTQSPSIKDVDLPSGYEKPMGIAWRDNQIYTISNNPFGNRAAITIFDANFSKINTVYIDRGGNDFQSITFDSEGNPWIAGIGTSDEIKKYNSDFTATTTVFPITAAGFCFSADKTYVGYYKELKIYSGIFSEISQTFTFETDSITGVTTDNQGNIFIGSSPSQKIYRLKGI